MKNRLAAFMLLLSISLFFISCGSPLGKFISTGNLSTPDNEIQEDGYYFVRSSSYYGIFGPVKYFSNEYYGNIRDKFINEVSGQLKIKLPESVVIVEGPYPSGQSAKDYKESLESNIKWTGSGRYSEIFY